jgi:hypothetical protein
VLLDRQHYWLVLSVERHYQKLALQFSRLARLNRLHRG